VQMRAPVEVFTVGVDCHDHPGNSRGPSQAPPHEFSKAVLCDPAELLQQFTEKLNLLLVTGRTPAPEPFRHGAG
jgi:hypothetical protein